MTNPTSNFGWQMPTSTDLVTDLPADFAVFGQAVDTSMADLKGGTTGQILSKATNTDMDFTWITNDVGDITAVTAGTGISGGGTTGAVTITNSMATEIAAKADLIVGTGAATFDNLAVGTNGQVLTADSTVSPTGLKWATPASGATLVGCSLWNNANLTLSNNTMTSVTYNSENYDTDGFHSTSSNTNRITIPSGKAGKYQISVCIQFDNSSVGLRQVFLFKNGGGWLDLYGPQSSASRSTYFLYTIEDLSVGDYLEVQILQSCGGLLTAFFNGTKNYFTVNYLGA